MDGGLRGGGQGAAPSRDVPEGEILARLRLSLLPGVGDLGLHRLLDAFGSATAALEAPGDGFADVAGAEAAEARGRAALVGAAREVVERCRELEVRILARGGEAYPPRLLHLHLPPPLLFVRGDPAALGRPSVAVVGSRRSTGGGRRTAGRLGRALSSAGIPVVSGLALGIDAAAHEGALDGPGGTVAVLGCGAEMAYPPSHRELYREIVRVGAVASEFAPGTPPLRHHFPRRNRIMAALAEAVIVVEAGERSGALITAREAGEIGRDVWAVPGPVDRPSSRGSNALLRDGAGIVLDPDRIVEEIGLACPRLLEGAGRPGPGGRAAPTGAVGGAPGGDDGRLWALLDEEPRPADALVRASGLPTPRALAALARLEVDGRVERTAGMRYRLAGAGG